MSVCTIIVWTTLLTKYYTTLLIHNTTPKIHTILLNAFIIQHPKYYWYYLYNYQYCSRSYIIWLNVVILLKHIHSYLVYTTYSIGYATGFPAVYPHCECLPKSQGPVGEQCSLLIAEVL